MLEQTRRHTEPRQAYDPQAITAYHEAAKLETTPESLASAIELAFKRGEGLQHKVRRGLFAQVEA